CTFIAPCLPTKTYKQPTGGEWLHEIKHDGFRVIARKKGSQVRFYSRPGNDLTYRFPLIVEALFRLRSRSRWRGRLRRQRRCFFQSRPLPPSDAQRDKESPGLSNRGSRWVI